MKTIFRAFVAITFCIFFSDCSNSPKELDTVAQKVETISYFSKRFNPKCQLIAIKYNLEESVVRNILLSYIQKYNELEYYLLTEGDLSAGEKAQLDYSEYHPKDNMALFLHEIAERNKLSDSTTACVIFDYLTLEVAVKTSSE